MDRTERFYRIEALIKSRGCVGFDALMSELEVSRATLKRDLQYLRDRMNAPIVYSAFDRGYKLQADPRDASQANHELPGVWFSEREIIALLTLHQLVQGLDTAGVLVRHLQPLLDKLHGLLGAPEQESSELMKRIRIVSATHRPVASRWFELFGDALLKRRRVHMRYQSRGRNQMTEREVSPQRLVHYRSTWYLDAWCHSKETLLRFALDAVDQAAALEKKAKEVSLKTVEGELDGGYGIFAGNKAQWATLLFQPGAAQWVSREEWHPQQKTRWRADGRYEMKLPYTNETELVMDVLRHGPDVEIASPGALRLRVQARLAEMVRVYDGAGPAVQATT